MTEIDFGYGLLGRIEKGGTFQIEREQVGDDRWKTSLLDVHISGRVVFFKAISKDQRESRSAFQPVSSNTTVQNAVTLLLTRLSPAGTAESVFCVSNAAAKTSS